MKMLAILLSLAIFLFATQSFGQSTGSAGSTCPLESSLFSTIQPTNQPTTIKSTALSSDGLLYLLFNPPASQPSNQMFNQSLEVRHLNGTLIRSVYISLPSNVVTFEVDQYGVLYAVTSHLTSSQPSNPAVNQLLQINTTNGALINQQSITQWVTNPRIVDTAISHRGHLYVVSVDTVARITQVALLPFNSAAFSSFQLSSFSFRDFHSGVIGSDDRIHLYEISYQQSVISYPAWPTLSSAAYQTTIAPLMNLVPGFALNPSMMIFVGDERRPIVRVFDQRQVLVRIISKPGSGWGYVRQLWVPNNDKLVVFDNTTSTVTVVSNLQCILYPPTSSSSSSTSMSISSSSSSASLPAGTLLREYVIPNGYQPTSIAVDKNGTMYGTANLEPRVWIMAPNGTMLIVSTSAGGQAWTQAVWSAKLDDNGAWWVLDYGNRQIVRIQPDGTVTFYYQFWWYYTNAIAPTRDGTRFAMRTYGYNTTYVYSAITGDYLCQVKGYFETFWGGMTYDRQGNLYVAEAKRDEDAWVRKYDSQCRFLREYGPFNRLSEIDVDDRGLLYVADKHRQNSSGIVYVVDTNTGQIVFNFGTNIFNTDSVVPNGLSLGPNNDIYVTGNNRVYRFSNMYGTYGVNYLDRSSSSSSSLPSSTGASSSAIASSSISISSSVVPSPTVLSSSINFASSVPTSSPIITSSTGGLSSSSIIQVTSSAQTSSVTSSSQSSSAISSTQTQSSSVVSSSAAVTSSPRSSTLVSAVSSSQAATSSSSISQPSSSSVRSSSSSSVTSAASSSVAPSSSSSNRVSSSAVTSSVMQSSSTVPVTAESSSDFPVESSSTGPDVIAPSDSSSSSLLSTEEFIGVIVGSVVGGLLLCLCLFLLCANCCRRDTSRKSGAQKMLASKQVDAAESRTDTELTSTTDVEMSTQSKLDLISPRSSKFSSV